MRSNSFEEGEDDTNLDHNFENYANMKYSFKDNDNVDNFKDDTKDDHNFSSLGEAARVEAMDATMEELMMGASKEGIGVYILIPT